MFKINKISLENSVEINDSMLGSYAKIQLEQGASIQKLVLNNKQIIKDCYPLTYKESYASAIMFPFCGRIDKGIYLFKGEKYQLSINDKVNNCALHGLLYNKKFEQIAQEITKEFASITLCYLSDGTAKGFPFKYKFIVTYILTDTALTTKITIKNLDENPFPFSLGWHPYFYSENLRKSTLSFQSTAQAVFNENLLVDSFEKKHITAPFNVEKTQFDDCYAIAENNVYFSTPDYKISLNTDNSNYLQIYTPAANKNVIAIEPITAPSNSFNNKIGLQVLESKQQYTMNWKIKLIDKDIIICNSSHF